MSSRLTRQRLAVLSLHVCVEHWVAGACRPSLQSTHLHGRHCKPALFSFGLCLITGMADTASLLSSVLVCALFLNVAVLDVHLQG